MPVKKPNKSPMPARFKPNNIIILAWNVYKDIINKIEKYNKIKYAIIPLPKLKIIKL